MIRLRPGLYRLARTAHPELPPAAPALTLEVLGVLSARARDALRLHLDELRDLTGTLGLNREA